MKKKNKQSLRNLWEISSLKTYTKWNPRRREKGEREEMVSEEIVAKNFKFDEKHAHSYSRYSVNPSRKNSKRYIPNYIQ